MGGQRIIIDLDLEKKEKVELEKRLREEREEKELREIWKKVETQVKSEVDLKRLELEVLKEELEKGKRKGFGIEQEDIAGIISEKRKKIEDAIKIWFPFTENELKKMGIRKRDVFHMLKLKLTAKEKWKLILNKIKDGKLKEVLKDIVDGSIDDIVVLYLFLFILEELFATGQLTKDVVELIKNVLKMIGKRCKCPIKTRQKQIEYLKEVKKIAEKYCDFTGFMLRMFSSSFLANIGGCSANG